MGPSQAEAVIPPTITVVLPPPRFCLLRPHPIGYEPPTGELADILTAEAEEEERLLAQYNDALALI